jgi:O-antigen ligase
MTLKQLNIFNVDNGKILLLFFTISIYLPMIFTNVMSALLIIYVVLNIKNLDHTALKGNKIVRLMTALYLLVFLGFFYEINTEGVFNDLEKKLSFLILPTAVCVMKISKQDVRKVLALFFFSGFLFTSIAFCEGLLELIDTKNVDAITNHNFSLNINLHATYLSMYLLFSLAYPLFFYNTLSKTRDKVITVFIAFSITAFLMLLSVRIIWVLLFIVFITHFSRVFSNNRVRLMFLIFAKVLIFAALIYSVPSLKERFKEAINYNNEYRVSSVWKKDVKEVWGGRGIRMLIWESCIDLIKQKPLTGYGSTTEVQKQLNNYYTKEKIGPLLFMINNRGKAFNPHNQYLEEILKFGIFMGLIYFCLGLYFFQRYYRKGNMIGVFFVTIIFGVSLTETIFELNKGVVFISFFFPIVNSYLEDKPPKKVKRQKK